MENYFDEIINYKQLESTNKKAESLIIAKEIAGNFLITAKTQTGGIGRKGNSWSSPVGGIWMSAAFYNLDVSSSLTLFVGISILKALKEIFPKLNFSIKWPNDIYINNKKLCGIMTNYLTNFKYHIVGIGINVFNEIDASVQNIATSLKKETNLENIDNTYIIQNIFKYFWEELPDFIQNGLDKDFFNLNSYLKQKEVILSTAFQQYEGKYMGINKEGAILLNLDNNITQAFISGSIIGIK